MSETDVRRFDAATPTVALSDAADESPFVPEKETPTASGLGEVTALDSLAAALQEEVSREPITLEVPSRKGVAVRFDPNFTAEQYQSWERRCSRRGPNGDQITDNIKLACTLLAHQALCVIKDGQDVVEPKSGAPITFRHRTLWEMTRTDDSVKCVRAFYGIDGHIAATATALTLAAGFGEEVDELDPTRGETND